MLTLTEGKTEALRDEVCEPPEKVMVARPICTAGK